MTYRRSYNPDFGTLGAEVAHRWPERTVIRNKAKQVDTLGIALSGGGYRSAIYNYGILRGLHEIGVMSQADYLSVVSGGSWIGTAYATTNLLDRWFFDRPDEKPNTLEEGFESFLANPARTAQELILARKNENYVSNVYGRLLARTFLREHGQDGRWMPFAQRGLVKDRDRPYLIVNGTVNFRPAGTFHVQQECFEMTRHYCGSRSLGYTSTRDLHAKEKPLRMRDAVAISGAAVAAHLPGLGDETIGIGLSRALPNYLPDDLANAPTDADEFDVADGGHYNNLGVESLVNRGCGYLIVVDAEHDPESPTRVRSNQKYHGLTTLLRRNHIDTAFGHGVEGVLRKIDRVDEPVHLFEGDDTVPDILYVKLKRSSSFDRKFKSKPYNQPGFVNHLFGRGKFGFDPQFSTAKLDYDFAEHRNLSDLGHFVVTENKKRFQDFAARSR